MRQVKVRKDSSANRTGGALCKLFRESHLPIQVLATGSAAVNQAVKSIAVATKYLYEEEPRLYLIARSTMPCHSSSKIDFILHINTFDVGADFETNDISQLCVTPKTDSFKLAGAIAGRIRSGQFIHVTTKGPIPTLVASKAVCIAEKFTEDYIKELQFSITFVKNDDSSTALQFALYPALSP